MTEIQQDKELRDEIDILIRSHTRREPYITNTIDRIMFAVQARDKELERKARLEQLYAVGNTFFPSGVSDGSSQGEWLQNEISKLEEITS